MKLFYTYQNFISLMHTSEVSHSPPKLRKQKTNGTILLENAKKMEITPTGPNSEKTRKVTKITKNWRNREK